MTELQHSICVSLVFNDRLDRSLPYLHVWQLIKIRCCITPEKRLVFEFFLILEKELPASLVEQHCERVVVCDQSFSGRDRDGAS